MDIDDLVSRLQTWTGDIGTDLAELMDEAADEIERLRTALDNVDSDLAQVRTYGARMVAENGRLRKELEVARDEDRRWENLHLLKADNAKLQKALRELVHLWRADNAELQKALGKLIFAARYTNISPDAIKEAEAALNLASGESPTSQAIHGESRPARD